MILLQFLVKDSVESRVTPRSVIEWEIVIAESRLDMDVGPADWSMVSCWRVENRMASDLVGLNESLLSANHRQREVRQSSMSRTAEEKLMEGTGP